MSIKSYQLSPFIYGNTVSERGFTNREEETERLKANLLGGINTMLLSPRRWGKSSLVEKVVNEINKTEKNHKAIVLDLFSAGCVEEFLELFAREIIKASSNKWQDWLEQGKTWFKHLVPQFSIGVDPTTDLSVSFDWKELAKHPDEVLNLPEIIAGKKGFKLIVCLDEFQNLAGFNAWPEWEKKMRSVWQRQKSVTYCIYGSKRHMMTDIFNNPAKPFYRFGDIMLLKRIETQKWVKFITKGFKSTGKGIEEEVAEQIPQLMKNHSWYVQQLAHYTWTKTNEKADLLELNKALEELIHSNSPLYQREVEIISTTQLNLLKAVVKGETRFTSSAVMQQYNLGTPRNVAKNKQILINSDMIHEAESGRFELLDPAFELWFKYLYFNSNYKIINI